MSCATPAEKEYFENYVQIYTTSMPVRSVDLTSHDRIYRVELATGGNLRRLSSLAQQVLMDVEDEKKQITLNDYADAYELIRERPIFNQRGDVVNPFTVDLGVVKRLLGYA
ncbi:hypothetical protein GCM10011369_18680 [Neiella marina]|uniref:Uncharacterized protein n=2 Tax=Neiella marina TaxID=508461 RepID=A0A8J2U538_9GAMM|nr:hypothetical protein GCM10011369_18680 [Neiella marina]